MRYGLIGLLVIACTGLSLRAQDAGSPAAPSQAAPSQADQMLNDILKPTPVVVSPSTRPSDLAILQPQGYVPTPKSTLLREGSDVIAREGRLHKVADSPYPEFIFDNKPPETKLDRMLVLPNLQLMSMEDAAAATHADLTFTVSGTVTEYQGKNYILLEPGPDEVSKQIPAPVLTVPSGNGPVSADQMLNQMLSSDKPAGPAPTAIPPVEKDATSGAGAIAAGAPVVNVLREQSQIFDRVGRLSLGSDGQQEELVLDADGKALQDPPLIVLPNLKLVALEGAAGDHRDTRFRVTGVVTEYRGRNCILLQKVVVMADSDRQF